MADEEKKEGQTNEESSGKLGVVNDWDSLLKFTRRNYLKTVEELTKVQERTEEMFKNLRDKGSSYSNESSKVIKQWAGNLSESFDKFQKNTQKLITQASDKAEKELNITIPFRKEMENLAKAVQDNMKNLFERINTGNDDESKQ